MLFELFNLLFILVCTSSAAPAKSQRQDDDSLFAKARCGAVNVFVTMFVPRSHATAFCSAYLQVPMQTSISTATVTASASTTTVTSSQIMPTLTRTVSTTLVSTSTITVDLWTGRPACSTTPSFSWLHDRQRQNSSNSPAILEQVCSCLAIPTSTSTVTTVTTITPTSTVTEGITVLSEVTSTHTRTAVQTQTNFIFLVDRAKDDPQDNSVAHKDRDVALLMTDRALRFEQSQSSWNNSSDTGVLHNSIQPVDIRISK